MLALVPMLLPAIELELLLLLLLGGRGVRICRMHSDRHSCCIISDASCEEEEEADAAAEDDADEDDDDDCCCCCRCWSAAMCFSSTIRGARRATKHTMNEKDGYGGGGRG